MKRLELVTAARWCALALGVVVSMGTTRPQLTKLPDVSDFPPERDLADYETYAWNKNQRVATENVANHLRIVNAIQAQMKELGYRLDPTRPDMRIQYRLELHERLEGSSSQERSVWDPAQVTVKIDFSTEKEARFSLQLVDEDSSFLLWHAEGTYRLGSPDRAERQINEAVADIFEQFPEDR